METENVAVDRIRGAGAFLDRAKTGKERIEGLGLPVTGEQGPHDGAHAESECGLDGPGAAKSEGRTEPTRDNARGCDDGVGTAEEFLVSFFAAAKEKIGMSEGVVGDEMAAVSDFADEGGRFANVFADEEESGTSAVPVEEVKKLWGDGGIGAVVKGESEEFGRMCLGDGRTEELSTGMGSAVGSSAGRSKKKSGAGSKPFDHEGIVARNVGAGGKERATQSGSARA